MSAFKDIHIRCFEHKTGAANRGALSSTSRYVLILLVLMPLLPTFLLLLLLLLLYLFCAPLIKLVITWTVVHGTPIQMTIDTWLDTTVIDHSPVGTW